MTYLSEYTDICNEEYQGAYYGQDDVQSLNDLQPQPITNSGVLGFMRFLERNLTHDTPLNVNILADHIRESKVHGGNDWANLEPIVSKIQTKFDTVYEVQLLFGLQTCGV